MSNISVNPQNPIAASENQSSNLPQNPMDLAADQQRISMLERSNKQIVSLILKLDGDTQKDVEKILKSAKFFNRLSQLFKYYKPKGGDETFSLVNKKILGRDVSEGLGKLISEVAMSLNLSLENTFEIAEIFFESKPEDLDHFLHKENLYNYINFNNEIKQAYSQ